MVTQLVVVADAARARFFVWGPPDGSGPEGHGTFTEVEDEIAPEDRLPDSVEAGGSKSGLARKPGAHCHTYDDHRQQHTRTLHAEFARQVMTMAGTFLASRTIGRLVLAASPTFLGQLRRQHRLVAREGLEILEVGKDLTRFDAGTIRTRLVEGGLLVPGTEPKDHPVRRNRPNGRTSPLA